MDNNEYEKRIKELEAQLEQKKIESNLKIKVGQKRNVSVYGLGQRFPVTLYAPGWVKLIENIEQVKDFIEDHKNELSWEK